MATIAQSAKAVEVDGANPATWLLAALAGAVLGFVFFRGLQLTVERLASSTRPGTLMLASLVLRTAIALGGFYAIARLSELSGLVAALAGFVLVRTLLLRGARRAIARDGRESRESRESREEPRRPRRPRRPRAMIAITPDDWVLWHWGALHLNATIAFTWLVMILLVAISWLVTRRLTSDTRISRWQNALEVLVVGMRDQIAQVSRHDPGVYLPFVGTLFVFIAASNLLAIVPGFHPPTGSLSTTTALALCVFVAVPAFGVADQGPLRYLRHYVRPTALMLPFNLIGEFSRTVALAVRLYGNIMSGTVLAGILLSLTPFFFPIVMQLLGLLTGIIQAYIFAVLAMVYIASAASTGRAGGGDASAGHTKQSTDSTGENPKWKASR